MDDATRTTLGTPGSASGDLPSSIGPFKILGLLGQGGFGVVYEAEQSIPVRRRVALKLIKPGMDSAAVVARFEAERQALAVMDHACIAKVFDGGITGAADGHRPYFVMELVKGDPITEFCDRQTLTLDERVELFIEVCAAVQHAHSKGVVHRDLKPSNILVSYDGDGRARPKVIDFGVAKALNQRLSEHTMFTERGQLIGTPEYMSPEQAEMSGVDIDTRADVYSLGVVLYELLAGQRPFDLREVAYHEIQRIIREQPPPKPSTRLSTMISHDAAEATRITRARHADGRSLTGTLRRDLDWVVMRCLEKDRERRYQAASVLADELRRYLAGEAVEAGPPSITYRVGKFVRRHRGAVAAVLSVAAAVLLALAATATALAATQRAEQRAIREAQAARTAEQAEARARAEVENALAEREAAVLVREADLLWPIHPDTVPAMEAWLQRARRVSADLPKLRRGLAELRAGATEDNINAPDATLGARITFLERFTDAMRANRKRYAAMSDEQASALGRDRAMTLAVFDDVLPVYEQELATARLAAERRSRAWRYDSPTNQRNAERLGQQIAHLERLTERDGLIDLIKQRRDTANSLAAASVEGHASAWPEAIASIADTTACPQYAGLVIEPQLGLVPLWRDDHSGLWEFWHVLSGDRPRRAADGAVRVTPTTGIVLVLIPQGTYNIGAMGRTSTVEDASRGRGRSRQDHRDENADPGEGPVTAVGLDAYFIAKHELTQGQWQRLTGQLPSENFPGVHGSVASADPNGQPLRDPAPFSRTHPVEHVDWLTAHDALDRWGLTLPTEAQWEAAARGRTNTRYWTGDAPASIADAENSQDAAAARQSTTQTGPAHPDALDFDGYLHHAPVDSHPPNPFGLVSILGNVSEWTLDWYDAKRANNAEATGLRNGDGLAVHIEMPAWRTFRGGNFESTLTDLRVTKRNKALPTARDETVGIRPARPLD